MRKTIDRFSAALTIGCILMCATQSATAISIDEEYTRVSIDSGSAGSDRNIELLRCIKNWKEIDASRSSFDPSESPSGEAMLLEIGNSGFPRYDFVRIYGHQVSSSFGADIIHPSDALSHRLDSVFKAVWHATSEIQLDVDDGDCYFLTVRAGNTSKTLAFYGTRNTALENSLVTEIIDIASGR